MNQNENLLVSLEEWNAKQADTSLPEWDKLVPIDLYMDQVTALVNGYLGTNDVTPAMINNYVKLKMMPPPIKKKYSKMHLAYIMIICTLKPVLSMSAIQKLVNSELDEDGVRSIYAGLSDSRTKAVDYVSKHIKASSEVGDESSAILQFAMSASLYKSLTEHIVQRMFGAKQK